MYFFYASKVIWPLIAPLNLACYLLLLAVLPLKFCKKHSSFFLISGLVLMFVGGMLPVGNNLMVYLESRYDRPDLPENIAGFIVPGGYLRTDISYYRGEVQLNDNADRIFKAMELGNKYDNALIVFSGKSSGVIEKTRAEDEDTEDFLRQLDYPDNMTVYEAKSHNTFDNILLSRNYVSPEPSENWVVITSAYHMPRTMAVANSIGWNLIPYPTDYRTTGMYSFWPKPFNVLQNFTLLETSVKEIVGMVAYRLSGRITPMAKEN